MTKMQIKHRPAILFSVFTIFIVFLIILADIDKLPVNILSLIPRYDLFGHFFLYGLFYRLLDDFLDGKTKMIKGLKIPIALGISVSLTVLEEISQIFFISRTFSLMDLWFGFQGIYFFYRRYPEKILRYLLAKKKAGK